MDARALGGRLEAAHGELGVAGIKSGRRVRADRPTDLTREGFMKRTRLIAGAVAMAFGGLFTQVQAQSDFKPVTDAMLQNPDPSEWLGWRATQDAQGFSPPHQMQRDNGGRLHLP